MHLAIGGFYQKGSLNANPIVGANGDMGENETAGFGPIFFLHHCFVDYTFWKWQEKQRKTDCLEIWTDHHPPYPGTFSTGYPDNPVFTQLTLETPLYPFKKDVGSLYKSVDLINIEKQLGYQYAVGGLDALLQGTDEEEGDVQQFKVIRNLSREQISGSFVIRTFASGPGDVWYEIGREAILSRWSVVGCRNCHGKTEARSLVPIHKALVSKLDKVNEGRSWKYRATISTRTASEPTSTKDTMMLATATQPMTFSRTQDTMVLGTADRFLIVEDL